MTRAREISFRVLSSSILWALHTLCKKYRVDTVYQIDETGASVVFEGAKFRYNFKNRGATGNMDFEPEAENSTRNALFSRMKPGDVFYDIGAHGGLFTVTSQVRVYGLDVYSFEPQPSELIDNLLLNRLPTGKTFAVAVGSKDGSVTMTSGNRSSNYVTDSGDITVPIVILDDLVQKDKIPNPNWIKIDIEGMELDALNGLKTTIEKSKPVIVIELNHLFGRFGTTIADWAEFAANTGYTVHRQNLGELIPVDIGGAESLSDLGPSDDHNFWLIPN
ncbi:MAG: FkbM family methyltransferase [Sphingomonadales bacterium]